MNLPRAAAVAGLVVLAVAPRARAQSWTSAPGWTAGATCYEVFVRSFYDSDGDGVGDFNGLTSKLDYINDGNPSSHTSLGASCIWLMPIMPSPSYHGYDITDYYGINPQFGTMADFQRFLAEAHRRGIRVLIDMVLNHSSSRHPYFQAALHDTTSPYRAWYRFSPTSLGPGPWGGPAWRRSPVRDEYYYGAFSPGMPDLNYDTPAVREEAMKIADFWLRMGVDGFRLDAVPYLVEQGACLQNCPGTHLFLHQYGAHIDSVEQGVYTVGEVWGPVDTLLPYYPDQLTSYFCFECAFALDSAVGRGTAGGMLAPYLNVQRAVPAYRYAPILDNHDQPRVMSVLRGDPARARLAATLLLTLPGLPFVYYGEEIGMIGDKPDPRLRTPMQWTAGHAAGFTTGTPWETLQPDTASVNVAAETGDAGSLLNLYRRLIHFRLRNDALASGALVPLAANDSAVVAYLRRSVGGHAVLVVANLGGAPVGAVSVTAGAGTLPAGTYATHNLLGGAHGASLVAAADGGVRYLVRALAPREARVLDLTRH